MDSDSGTARVLCPKYLKPRFAAWSPRRAVPLVPYFGWQAHAAGCRGGVGGEKAGTLTGDEGPPGERVAKADDKELRLLEKAIPVIRKRGC